MHMYLRFHRRSKNWKLEDRGQEAAVRILSEERSEVSVTQEAKKKGAGEFQIIHGVDTTFCSGLSHDGERARSRSPPHSLPFRN